MAVLKIYQYPHPILRQVCSPVTVFDERLQQLARDMVETMYARPGSVGLAAPQVGHPIRMLVMDVTAATTREALKVLVNPVIVQQSRNKVVREGCLSFPDYLANVKRATRLTVQAHDPFGQLHEYDVKHLEAVCVQHEIDHLDGVLMIDRIDSLKTDWIRRTGPRQSLPPSSTHGDDAEDSSVPDVSGLPSAVPNPLLLAEPSLPSPSVAATPPLP